MSRILGPAAVVQAFTVINAGTTWLWSGSVTGRKLPAASADSHDRGSSTSTPDFVRLWRGHPRGVPTPPVHSPPGSGAWLPDLYVSMKEFNRGSLAEFSFSCTPHADATIGDGSPG